MPLIVADLIEDGAEADITDGDRETLHEGELNARATGWDFILVIYIMKIYYFVVAA